MHLQFVQHRTHQHSVLTNHLVEAPIVLAYVLGPGLEGTASTWLFLCHPPISCVVGPTAMYHELKRMN